MNLIVNVVWACAGMHNKTLHRDFINLTTLPWQWCTFPLRTAKYFERGNSFLSGFLNFEQVLPGSDTMMLKVWQVYAATRCTIRYGLMLLWFED